MVELDGLNFKADRYCFNVDQIDDEVLKLLSRCGWICTRQIICKILRHCRLNDLKDGSCFFSTFSLAFDHQLFFQRSKKQPTLWKQHFELLLQFLRILQEPFDPSGIFFGRSLTSSF